MNSIREIRLVEKTDSGNNRAAYFVEDKEGISRESSVAIREIFIGLLFAIIRELIGARSISLYRIDEINEMLVPVFWQGEWETGDIPRTFEKGVGIAGYVWKTGKVYVSQGNVQKAREYQKYRTERSKKVLSILSIPILNFSGELIGVMNLDCNNSDRFSTFLKQHISGLIEEFQGLVLREDIPPDLNHLFAVEIFCLALLKAIAGGYVIDAKIIRQDLYNKALMGGGAFTTTNRADNGN